MAWEDFSFEGAPGYVAPEGKNVVFSFAPGAFEAQYVHPDSADSALVELPFVSLRVRSLSPDGISSFQSSWSLVYNLDQRILARGFLGTDRPGAGKNDFAFQESGYVAPAGKQVHFSFVLPGAWVQNQTRHITVLEFAGQPPPVGIPEKVFIPQQTQYITTRAFSGQPPAVGIPEKVFDPLQTCYASGAEHQGSGTPFVSNQYRWMYFAGAAHSVFGATQARLGRRYLGPVGLPGKQTDFGTPFVSDGQRNVTPPGVQGGVFGEPLVRDFATYLFPLSRKSGVRFGDTAVRDPRQTAGIRGDVSLEVGIPFAYLQTQFLRGWAPEPDDAWYGAPDVANLNRRVFPAPFVSHRFPFHTFPLLANTGRAVVSHGADQTEWGGTWVSNYYRSVFQQFAQAPEKAVFGTTQVQTRQVIHLLGRGMHTLRVALPVRVWSNLQTIKAESVRPTAGVGTPWASFSRREIRPPAIVRSVL